MVINILYNNFHLRVPKASIFQRMICSLHYRIYFHLSDYFPMVAFFYLRHHPYFLLSFILPDAIEDCFRTFLKKIQTQYARQWYDQ